MADGHTMAGSRPLLLPLTSISDINLAQHPVPSRSSSPSSSLSNIDPTLHPPFCSVDQLTHLSVFGLALEHRSRFASLRFRSVDQLANLGVVGLTFEQ
jgi:hypothetical protein